MKKKTLYCKTLHFSFTRNLKCPYFFFVLLFSIFFPIDIIEPKRSITYSIFRVLKRITDILNLPLFFFSFFVSLGEAKGAAIVLKFGTSRTLHATHGVYTYLKTKCVQSCTSFDEENCCLFIYCIHRFRSLR